VVTADLIRPPLSASLLAVACAQDMRSWKASFGHSGFCPHGMRDWKREGLTACTHLGCALARKVAAPAVERVAAIFGSGLLNAFQNCKISVREHPLESPVCCEMMHKRPLRAARRSVTAPLCCRLMEGANLVLSRAPLLEPVVRLVGWRGSNYRPGRSWCRCACHSDPCCFRNVRRPWCAFAYQQ